jgi:hypothetical protein
MGNICTSSNVNDAKCITMQEWLTHINTLTITTKLAVRDNIYFYHLQKGDLENSSIPGHITFTYKLNTDFMERLFKLCKEYINSSGINDPMYERSSLIICTEGHFGQLQLLPRDKDILKRIKGFCLCHIGNLKDYTKKDEDIHTQILYIDILCSSCNQGRNILDVIHNIKPQEQEQLFGGVYTTIGLTSVPNAVQFYEKCNYVRFSDSDMPFMIKNASQQGSGKTYKTYKGRRYLVHVGTRNGTYIVVNATKKYVPH